MISYKYINLLDINISEDYKIKTKENELEIKSPIIKFIIDYNTNKINLILNKNSQNHLTFLNILEYIHKLFRTKKIPCDSLKKDSIIIEITQNSKFYDKNNSYIDIKKIKNEGKCICSFTFLNGNFNLENLLLI